MLLKICDDIKYSHDTALAWTISAKNSLINHDSFCTSQIVFGKNSKLPNKNDTLPILEKVTSSADLAFLIANNTLQEKPLGEHKHPKKLKLH